MGEDSEGKTVRACAADGITLRKISAKPLVQGLPEPGLLAVIIQFTKQYDGLQGSGMKRRIIAIVATIAMLFVPHALAGGAAIAEIEKVDIAGIENFSRLSGSSGFGGSVAGFGGAE